MASSASSAGALDTAAIARELHESDVDATNSNRLDSRLSVFTDDVVYLSPLGPAVVGKAAVKRWGEASLGAYRIHGYKMTVEFRPAVGWAIERYAYRESDQPKAGGPLLADTGKGLGSVSSRAAGRDPRSACR